MFSEVSFNRLVQHRLVALYGRALTGSAIDDLLRDFPLAAHDVDRHYRSYAAAPSPHPVLNPIQCWSKPLGTEADADDG